MGKGGTTTTTKAAAPTTTTAVHGAAPAESGTATPTGALVTTRAKVPGRGQTYKGKHLSEKIAIEIQGAYVTMLKHTAQEIGLKTNKSNYFLTSNNVVRKAPKGVPATAWIGSHLKSAPTVVVPIPKSVSTAGVLDFFDQKCPKVHRIRFGGITYSFDRTP